MYNDTHTFINDSELTEVSYKRFLGVHIDKSLTWQNHNIYVMLPILFLNIAVFYFVAFVFP